MNTPTMTYPTYTPTKTYKGDVTVTGNFQGKDSTAMSIDPQGAAHIISLIIDLYSDPEAAVVREYISNALDSHVLAGQTRPVEIFSPAGFTPTFVVKDYGVGMSPDDLRRVYAVIGASTKREDMNQLGAYGLGCKSALSMATQFTVRAVKDGVKSIAVVMRKEDGTGDLDITGISRTDEPNGVTITIPVANPSSFNRKLKEYLLYAKPDSIRLDNKDNNFTTVFSDESLEYIKEFKTYYTKKNTSNTRFTVIVGGASYSVSVSDLHSNMLNSVFVGGYYSRQIALYSEIPIGSVDLTPSRDDLRYTPRTQKFLRELGEAVITYLRKHLMDEIATAPTRIKFMEKIRDNQNALYQLGISSSNPSNFEWKGEKFNPLFSPSMSMQGYVRYGEVTTNTDVSPSQQNILHDFSAASTYYLVIPAPDLTDDPEALTKLRNRLRTRWLTQLKVWDNKGKLPEAPSANRYNSYGHRLYIFFDKAPDSKWFTETFYKKITMEDFADAMAEWRSISAQNRKKSTGSATPRPAEKITYPVYSFNKEGQVIRENTTADEMSGNLLFAEENDSDNIGAELALRGRVDFGLETLELLDLMDKQIVLVSKYRKIDALFSRVGRTLERASVYITKKVEAAVKALPDDQKKFLYYRASYGYNNRPGAVLSAMYQVRDKINDKDFVRNIELHRTTQKWQALLSGTYGYTITRHLTRVPEPTMSTFFEKYPLITYDSVAAAGPERVAEYVNFVYAKANSKSNNNNNNS